MRRFGRSVQAGGFAAGLVMLIAIFLYWNSPADTDATIYAFVDGEVAAIDGASGDIEWSVPSSRTGRLSGSPFLEVHEETGRLFVTDIVYDDGDSTDTLTVYRLSDGTVEYEEPVPDIIRYHGPAPWDGISVSDDGRYVYVYNYYDRRGFQHEVTQTYWFTVFDLHTGEWLEPEIDLTAECRGRHRFLSGDSEGAYLKCGGRIYEFDVDARQAVQVDVPAAETAAYYDGSLYILSWDFHLYEFDIKTGELSLIAEATAFSEFERRGEDIAGPMFVVDRSRILISYDNRTVLIVDGEEGEIIQTREFSRQPERIEFDPDGSGVFATLPRLFRASPLVYLDLKTGTETMIRRVDSGPITVSEPSQVHDRR